MRIIYFVIGLLFILVGFYGHSNSNSLFFIAASGFCYWTAGASFIFNALYKKGFLLQKRNKNSIEKKYLIITETFCILFLTTLLLIYVDLNFFMRIILCYLFAINLFSITIHLCENIKEKIVNNTNLWIVGKYLRDEQNNYIDWSFNRICNSEKEAIKSCVNDDFFYFKNPLSINKKQSIACDIIIPTMKIKNINGIWIKIK